jgi:hypothetical protein
MSIAHPLAESANQDNHRAKSHLIRHTRDREKIHRLMVPSYAGHDQCRIDSALALSILPALVAHLAQVLKFP